MKHNRLILLSSILLSFLLLTAWAAGFIQPLYANGPISGTSTSGTPTSGTITIVKDADPADGTNFAFTAAALPVTPTFALTWGGQGNGNGQFNQPFGVAVDPTGNVYVADSDNNRIQKFDSSGNFLLAWGSLGSGNGQFNRPTDVASDAVGNIYVVDSLNNRIQKFDSSGNFLLSWGSQGNGNGQFNEPFGVVVNAVGNVYVADTLNYRIQKFDSSGNFLLKWGSWGNDNGQFDIPTGMAVDAVDNVYVGDTVNHRIQKFDSNGNFLLAWGNNDQFYNPYGVAVDAVGNIYVVDSLNHRIQKFDSSGNFLLSWGSFGSGNSQFNSPIGVAVSTADSLYISDLLNHRIQKFTTITNTFALDFALDDAIPDDGDAITSTQTLTGLLPASYTFTEMVTGGWWLDSITCDGGSWTTANSSVTVNLADGQHITCTFSNVQPGQITIVKEANPADGTDFGFTTNAPSLPPTFALAWGSSGSDNGQFNGPFGMAVDPADNVYVTDNSNHRIQKFDSSGNFLLAWGSLGSGNGQFKWPAGVAVDTAGNVYVADSDNYRIQKFNSSGNFLLKWGSEGNGNGQFSSPFGVTVDAADHVYVVDISNGIQKFDSSGNFLLKWGSNGSGNGQFNYPHGVAVDTADNVYVADSHNHRIQKFDSSGNFLLNWGSFGSGNGQFYQPTGVAVDAVGNVYVADYDNNRIQKFNSSGNFLVKWGSPGSSNGQFSHPTGVTADAANNIYVADYENDRIQKFTNNNFALDNAVPDDGDGITNTQTFTSLLPSSYTFTETVTAGWLLDNITCDGGSWTTADTSVTVNLASGEHITCTFSNSGLPPDLQLVKNDGGITAEPGDILTYTLTYINNGGPSAGVTLTETVPLHTTFNPAESTTGWICLPDNNPGSVCTLMVGSVAFGSGGSVHFVVDVDNPLALGVTELENTAVIGDDGSNGPDQNPADNTATATTPVNSFYGGDLSGNDALSSAPGTAVTYTLTITNTGNNDDVFDLSFSGNSWPVTLSDATIGLAAGTSATFQVVVEIPAGAGDGETDVVMVAATSQGDGSQSDTADLTTTAEAVPDSYQIFMPAVIRQASAAAWPE